MFHSNPVEARVIPAELLEGAGGAMQSVRTGTALRALVIYNPAAGRSRRRRLAATLRLLEAEGCRVMLCETSGPGDAERLARSFDPEACDVIVAAGGDGTINEVANGLIASGHRVPLAIVPLGTANVLAKEIGLECRPRAVAGAILRRHSRTVHPGLANGRHFVQMAGAGVDAHVVQGVSLALKRRTGKFAYVAESLVQAFRYDFPLLTVTIDGTPHAARMVVVCNGRHYGGPFVAAPGASLASGEFHVVMLERGGIGAVLRYGVALLAGRLPYLSDVRVVTGRQVRIEGPDGAPVQGDGDTIASLIVDIAPARATLDLIVPA
jgi:YegS/Rv2252/BmrU family lipid kinase